jgi:hypothetical protein
MYYIANFDGNIYCTDNTKCNIIKKNNHILIEILSESGEVIDSCVGYDTMQNLLKSIE